MVCCARGVAGTGVLLIGANHFSAWCCMQVKEIIYPLGATIDVRSIALGDDTMSVLEIWGAEYQENDCLLIKPEDRGLLEAVAARERSILQVLHCLFWRHETKHSLSLETHLVDFLNVG